MRVTEKAQHTPGPWEVIVPPSSLLTTRLVRGGDGDTVALVGYRDFTAGQAADLANARLIAAAPEMLAALREAVGFIDSADAPAVGAIVQDSLVPSAYVALANILESARAAIAQAEGTP